MIPAIDVGWVWTNDAGVDPDAPVVIGTAEECGAHSTVTFLVGETVPIGASVFVDISAQPSPVPLSIQDTGGNSYSHQVGTGAASLWRGFCDTALSPGAEITITYTDPHDITAAVAYYVMGLDDAGPVDSAHALNAGVVGPVSVPENGIAIAAGYILNVTAENGYVQDPSFADIGSARSLCGATLRRVDSSFRRAAGTYSYDPTAETGNTRLTIAAYAPTPPPVFVGGGGGKHRLAFFF